MKAKRTLVAVWLAPTAKQCKARGEQLDANRATHVNLTIDEVVYSKNSPNATMTVKKVPGYENGQITGIAMFTYGVSAPILIAEPEDIVLPQAVATRTLRLSLVEGEQDSNTDTINQ